LAAKSLLEEEEETLAASSCTNSAPTSDKEPLSTLKWTPRDLMGVAGIGTGTTETHMIQAQAIPNSSVWVITNEGLGLKNVYTSGWAATCAKGVSALMMMNMYAAADTVLRDTLPASELRDQPSQSRRLCQIQNLIWMLYQRKWSKKVILRYAN